MRRLLAACCVAVLPLVGCGGEPEAPERTLSVTSPAFTDGGTIPARHTCDGDGAPPPLQWSGVPDDAAELAVLMEDPDAPGDTFVHWVAAGVDPSAPGLEEDAAPRVAGTNDFGSTGYRGPCPPEGDDAHRYVVTVFAADATLDLPPGPTAGDLRAALRGHEIARGQLVGHYGR